MLALSLAALAYFSAHALQGRHGLSAREALIARSALLDAEIKRLELTRQSLKTDIAALGAEPPDPDIIEEMAADLLGFVRSGDRIVVGLPPRRGF